MDRSHQDLAADMLGVTTHVLAGEIRDMASTYKSAACNARGYGEFRLCSWHIHIQADQKHENTIGEISPGMRSGMMANMFATLRKQVCMPKFIRDFINAQL